MKKTPITKDAYLAKRELKQTLKRYALTVLATLPVLIVIGVFLSKSLGSVVMIIINVLVMLTAILTVELIYSSRLKSAHEVEKMDVFK